MKANGSGMRRKNRILSYHFPPHSHPTSFKIIDNQQLTKTLTVFGCLRKYPSAGVILTIHWLSTHYKSARWLWGENGRFRPKFARSSGRRTFFSSSQMSKRSGLFSYLTMSKLSIRISGSIARRRFSACMEQRYEIYAWPVEPPTGIIRWSIIRWSVFPTGAGIIKKPRYTERTARQKISYYEKN